MLDPIFFYYKNIPNKKKGVNMKVNKLLSLALSACLCAGIFSSCEKQEAAKTTTTSPSTPSKSKQAQPKKDSKPSTTKKSSSY
jgi:hypothetical protein